MKKAILLFGLFLILTDALLAQSNRESVWNLVTALDNALVQKDSVKLKSLLTEDFIGAVPSGQSFPRSSYISYHCRPNVGLVSIAEEGIDKASIRFYGNMAIVNRRVEVVRKAPDGSSKKLTVQRIEVCVRQSEKWYVAAGQGTEVDLR